jgi:type II secretory pathway pseudopilin PulG
MILRMRESRFPEGWRPSTSKRAVAGIPAVYDRGNRAFTMIEIALCLGIIAFALVAIIGVLPTGMKVQRENREETIINQDATYILEAIRSGSKGLDELTNYVESITIESGPIHPSYWAEEILGTSSFLAASPRRTVVYTNNVRNPGNSIPLTNGQHIVSLLSTPKIEWLADGVAGNIVRARVRAISGVASEKRPFEIRTDSSQMMDEMAFRYEIISEVVPFARDAEARQMQRGPDGVPLQPAMGFNLSRSLHEFRLTFRWPVHQRGVGNSRKTFRTLVSGELVPVYTSSTPYLYRLQPHSFISAY